MNHKYLVTKRFVSGLLRGLTISEKTSVEFVVGRRYNPCVSGSAYVVLRVEAA